MKSKIIQSVGFLKTTAIGGLLFLLPLAVIGALLGYVYNAVLVVYTPLREYLPVSSTLGVLLLFLIAIAIVLFLCFVCGLAARRAIARQFTQTIEKQLVTVYPKYAIYKDILTGNISDGTIGPSLQPVTVRLDDMIRIGYEAGRTSQDLVIVYLPGSPDPWIGSVAIVESHRVEPLDVDFGETSAICERLGRESVHLLNSLQPSGQTKPPVAEQKESND
ncbi:DUF502 domain-containing protein [Aeoliella mucimassa]|uniref:DUF502 domain-containing protein n=1 Tax=Aeoliella mucimassa TaxID=2527972 RepID=A0A518APA3_9BACT|nr:hypothetical protein [Aeoliella mucimassa]QDU56559.1 hypothetical protein Pan181_27690 [Aeoliella mucimassa]